MAKADAQEAVKPRPRSVLKRLVRAASEGVRTATLEVGVLLVEARATFGPRETDAWLAWSATATGWQRAMIYRAKQAAEVVAETPAAAKLGDVAAIAHLSRVPAAKRAAVLKAAGAGANKVALEEAALKIHPPAPKSPASRQAEAEKLAKKVTAGARKYRDVIEALFNQYGDDPRTLMVGVAKLVPKMGADGWRFIAEILPETSTTEAGSDD